MADIGATLREARMRARIDVSEIEAQTKIRAKYLRALENEEWSLLPGPTFVRSFLRTYAEALGLDGKSLVEEYRLHHERPSDADRADHGQAQGRATRASSRSGGRGLGRSGQRGSGSDRGGAGGSGSRAYLAIVGAVCLVIVLLVIGLISDHGNGGGGNTASKHTSTNSTAGRHHHRHAGHGKPGSGKSAHRRRRHHAAGSHGLGPRYMTLALTATEPVWVCLIGGQGHELIAGETLEPGQRVEHRTKGHFEISLGNTALTMTLNHRPLELPEGASAVSYTITEHGLEALETPPECA